MNIGWPQGTILAMMFLVVCINASRNGEPRRGHYDLGAAMIGAAAEIAILYWGGFFS